VLAAKGEFVVPCELRAVQAAARRELPLSLGRELLAQSLGVSLRVLVGHLHHRMIVQTADVAALAVGSAPMDAEGCSATTGPSPATHDPVGWRENQATCLEHLGLGAGIVLRSRINLRPGHMAGLREWNCPLVTDVTSIQKGSTVTRCIGASSG
jgi:hypothetical protein